MCKDENSADSNVCFSDIWAAAQRTRSHHFRTLVARVWRLVLSRAAGAKLERAQELPSDARKEAGA